MAFCWRVLELYVIVNKRLGPSDRVHEVPTCASVGLFLNSDDVRLDFAVDCALAELLCNGACGGLSSFFEARAVDRFYLVSQRCSLAISDSRDAGRVGAAARRNAIEREWTMKASRVNVPLNG